MDDGGRPCAGGKLYYVKLDSNEPERASVPPPERPASVRVKGRGSRLTDRVIGILLGLVLGIGIVTAFVFLGSEETIDAPRVQGTEQPQQRERGAERP